MKISVVIIAYNEERHIVDCLKSAKGADEIIVVDSGSDDQTVPLAKREGANVFVHAFKDFSSQKNMALSMASGDWVFVLDADERMTKELNEEIRSIAEHTREKAAYAVKRDAYFFKKKMAFSGTQFDYPIRFWPKGEAHFEQPVHERVVTNLPIKKLKASMTHFTTEDMNQFWVKLGRYIPREVELMRQRKVRLSVIDLFFRPVLKFIFIFIIHLGFLDGFTGFRFAYLSAYYDYVRIRERLKVDNCQREEFLRQRT